MVRKNEKKEKMNIGFGSDQIKEEEPFKVSKNTATPFLDNFDQEFGLTKTTGDDFDQFNNKNPFDQFNHQKKDKGILEQVMDPNFLSLHNSAQNTMKTPFD